MKGKYKSTYGLWERCESGWVLICHEYDKDILEKELLKRKNDGKEYAILHMNMLMDNTHSEADEEIIQRAYNNGKYVPDGVYMEMIRIDNKGK